MAATNFTQSGGPGALSGGPPPLKARAPNLAWLGVALAAGFWLLESVLHAYVFGDDRLLVTLLSADGPNEIWMRVLTALLFVAFGWIANRTVRAEQHLQDDARKLHHLLQFTSDLKQQLPRAGANAR